MPPLRRKRHVEVEEEYDEFEDDADNMSDDEDAEEFAEDEPESQRDEEMLDDDAVFGLFKKHFCNSLRQMMRSGNGSQAGPSNIARNRRRNSGCGVSDARVRKVATRLNVTYFSEILEALDGPKRIVIETYGFGSLLHFDKCAIPLPFSPWIADQVQVRSSDIVVRNKSIPITVRAVHDILGIPFGGSSVRKCDVERGKKEFLAVLRLSRLPNFKYFGDKLKEKDISDDDLVRSFLIVALATFLCPNSNTYPSTKHLLPLVDIKNAKDWDWSKYVHFWLMEDIRKYRRNMMSSTHDSITLGGCFYMLCVLYLDHLVFGPQDLLPATLPRICVWKQGMIKEFSELDCVRGHTFGKHPILPFKSNSI
ncbi:uncharacterized protein LOC120701911 [Panicum virgatum]|uniref:uncharacterized protein LOC120701911 n=1 Tax=Panicum virgatum TaxID=38727 RepID=UPI0019D5C2F0|nr:uncharacterized protein LOC120701911 [Panicum virgatum]